MNTRRFFAGVVLLALVAAGRCARPAAAQGLFDDDKAKLTTGDIKNIDYWRAKWTMDRLEEAIKSRQPQGRIAVEVGSEKRTVEDLMKTYPMHVGLKKWHDRLVTVEKKIDPNANRQESFRTGCLWAEGDYELGYASYNAAKMAMAEKNWEEARDWLRQAVQKLGFLQARLDKMDRTANWPPEFIAWIKETGPDAEKLKEETAAHLK